MRNARNRAVEGSHEKQEPGDVRRALVFCKRKQMRVGERLVCMKVSVSLTDLASAALAGDEGAYETLVHSIWPNAYRTAWSILVESSAAEDVAQTACIAICAKLPDLADVRAFAGWSHRIIVSHARDHARARARLRSRESTGYEAAVAISTREDVTSRLDLEAAIGRLSEHLRLTLELHYFFGLTTREVGVALGIPSVTVRFRLMAARRRLRPLFQDSTAPAPLEETVR